MTKKKIVKSVQTKIEKDKKILFGLIITIGVLLRVLFLDKFPAGLNCDEASVSYNAFSILKTLSDRYGNFLPVYMPAFGGGQSVLLTYLTIPFVKLFGLNVFATRLPMAIISSISLIVFYKILGFTDFDDRIKAFALLFFVLNPWHIMKSRWGLDCNIFPDIVLIAILFLLKYFYSDDSKKIKNRKLDSKYLYLFFVFLAVSAYSYATSYVALGIYCILLYIYGLKTKTINVKQILVSSLLVLIIIWPLIIFIIINFFDLPEVKLPFCTIPRLYVNSMNKQTILSSGNIFLTIIKNIFLTLKLLALQYDGIYWNGIKGIGMYYIFSFPILIIGIYLYISDKQKKIIDNIFAIWLFAGIILCILLSNSNINRINFVIIPIIYFIIKGFSLFFKIKFLRISLSVVLLLSFLVFSYKYIDYNVKKDSGILINGYNTIDRDCFVTDMESLVKHLDEMDAKKINVVNICLEPHIYVLYYLGINPLDFRRNKNFNFMSYEALMSFGKWDFVAPKSPDDLIKDRSIVYVLDARNIDLIDARDFEIEEFKKYIIVRFKENV